MAQYQVEQRIKSVDEYLNSIKKRLQIEICSRMNNRNPIRVLEAGCGSTSHIQIDPQWQLTGIDISERQLLKNQYFIVDPVFKTAV